MFANPCSSYRSVLLFSFCVFASVQILAQGNALDFDGADDVVIFGTVSPIGVHTIEAWVKPSAASGTTVIAGQVGGPGLGCSLGAALFGGQELKYHVDIAGCGNGKTISGGATQVGVWTHVAGTYDGDTMRIYRDGVLMAQLSGVPFDSSTWMTAGAVTLGNGQSSFYAGAIDELRVWSVARSAAQIQGDMGVALSGSEPGLVGYWNMDEGSGQLVGDSTPSAITGTLGTSSQVQPSDPTWVVSTAPISSGTDSDGDAVPDAVDLCPGTAAVDPVDADGCSDAQVDADGDGVCAPGAPSDGPSGCTGSDNCPEDANAGQEDLDEDGLGDVCDADADGDGDPEGTDCDDLDPARYHGAAEICNDGIDNDCNGLVDLDDNGSDCDGDGIDNEVDNCPGDFNPGQQDLDGDGDGDICDDDDDGDGVLDVADNCPLVANAGQEDFDGDGVGDACDADGDGDGVDDFDGDLCHFTAENDLAAGVPSRSLGKNRWADLDGDGMFDTKGDNPTFRMFSIYSTAGCNCAQIIQLCGYGQGHTKFGCSNSVMDWWVGAYDREGQAAYQCKGE